jgi:hypothetical protein
MCRSNDVRPRILLKIYSIFLLKSFSKRVAEKARELVRVKWEQRRRNNIKAFFKGLDPLLKTALMLRKRSLLDIAFEPLTNPCLEDVKRPLEAIGTQGESRRDWKMHTYELKAMTKFLSGEEAFEVGDFPNNIEEYYWAEEDLECNFFWFLLCRIATPTGPAYAFYKAGDDYINGFDDFDRSFMTLTVSKSVEKLFETLTEPERQRCLTHKASFVCLDRILGLKKSCGVMCRDCNAEAFRAIEWVVYKAEQKMLQTKEAYRCRLEDKKAYDYYYDYPNDDERAYDDYDY